MYKDYIHGNRVYIDFNLKKFHKGNTRSKSY